MVRGTNGRSPARRRGRDALAERRGRWIFDKRSRQAFELAGPWERAIAFWGPGELGDQSPIRVPGTTSHFGLNSFGQAVRPGKGLEGPSPAGSAAIPINQRV